MKTTREFVLEHNGSNLHYWLSVSENAPLVVLTHGACLNHQMFEAQIEPLVSAGYATLTWDMRGHGKSKPLGSNFTVGIAADDLLAILNDTGYETACFVGHSFGGFVTQEFAFRYPERVSAMGVIGCTDMTAKPSQIIAIASKPMPFLLRLMSLESFRKQTVEHVSIREDVTQYAYEATGNLNKEEYIKVILAGLECLTVDAGYGDNYTIPVPFLLTHGEKDSANNGIFPKSAPDWAAKEVHCTYKAIPDAGHCANQDNPDTFNTILLDFLKEHIPV